MLPTSERFDLNDDFICCMLRAVQPAVVVNSIYISIFRGWIFQNYWNISKILDLKFSCFATALVYSNSVAYIYFKKIDSISSVDINNSAMMTLLDVLRKMVLICWCIRQWMKYKVFKPLGIFDWWSMMCLVLVEILGLLWTFVQKIPYCKCMQKSPWFDPLC